MNIVFFSNAEFFGDQIRPQFSSMPRFASMLAEGMSERGHRVAVWSPESRFFRLPVKGSVKKWMGYIDQYLVFPQEVKRRIRECPKETLFVFTDQAQGPWMPLVKRYRHVIHCHDFLALRSAMDLIPEHKTGWTGKKYQAFIRKGYTPTAHFICGSQKTRTDLQNIEGLKEVSASVIYNGLPGTFVHIDSTKARTILANKIGVSVEAGYILHVGGNQWYKNRRGVIEIYHEWRLRFDKPLPLLLIGAEPNETLFRLASDSEYSKDIHFLSGLSDTYVRYAYAGASVFLFPSLAEGFGWPIAEAMASGCPVITTDQAPMTEVAGDAGFFIPVRDSAENKRWVNEAAALVNRVVSFTASERKEANERCLGNAKRFNIVRALDEIQTVYNQILNG